MGHPINLTVEIFRYPIYVHNICDINIVDSLTNRPMPFWLDFSTTEKDYSCSLSPLTDRQHGVFDDGETRIEMGTLPLSSLVRELLQLVSSFQKETHTMSYRVIPLGDR